MNLTRIFTRQTMWVALNIIVPDVRTANKIGHWQRAFRKIARRSALIFNASCKKPLMAFAVFVVGILLNSSGWNTTGFGSQSIPANPHGAELGEEMPNLQGEIAFDFLKQHDLYASIKAKAEDSRGLAINPVFTEIKKLAASDGGAADYFGSALAISGDTAIVGAYQAENGNIFSEGAAYIFERSKDGTNNWVEVKKLIPTSNGDSGE